MNNKQRLSKYWINSINQLLKGLKLNTINPKTFY